MKTMASFVAGFITGTVTLVTAIAVLGAYAEKHMPESTAKTVVEDDTETEAAEEVVEVVEAATETEAV